MNKPPVNISPQQAAAHLTPAVWKKVNLLHVRKIISEFAHELLIVPQLKETVNAWGHYILSADDPAIEYHFRAKVLKLDHWHIDITSLCKYINGEQSEIDSLRFIIEFKTKINISEAVLPVYLEEISSTLYSSAYHHTYNTLTSETLAISDYQVIEQAMMAGHPCFIANNGRIGFDATDYRRFAPESADPFPLLWVAAHKERTGYTGGTALPYDQLIAEELDTDTLAQFFQILDNLQLDRNDYYFIPVHPWQWFNKLAIIFANDLSSGQLVYLGPAKDKYIPQQSIRTFYNITSPQRRYTKTSLSILNMGFMRGLHASFVLTAPPICEWVNNIVESDDFLREKGFVLLQEVAAVGYTNPHYASIIRDDNSSYNGMLSALWRESPRQRLKPGQRLMTMAALLHVDTFGNALLPSLIKASGMSTTAWLKQYLDCYLTPLLHCYYYHDMRFMPHGENVILIIENNVPAGVIMKDIAEEIAVLNPDLPMPENVRQIYMKVADHLKILSIFTQAFDCFFRFLQEILVEHAAYPETQFWGLVADCVTTYQQRFPQLQEKYEKIDLFAPEIIKTCLNRLQIRNNRKMVDHMYDPFKSQQFAGTLQNPLAAFSPQPVTSIDQQ
ncbi:IucA/IucC family siderophore biosynthesis protein [Chitinophaga sp. Cy-1792]|uniref:IucA/IucC family protein n=1 Tax=Chitinophaga sp. Cy-1792 TaxID=2608339 RepID=UPI00141D7C20|nr:IucA/IucC family siderophore biosynthesis protein [Chitinophaga sp. Cy-1792]NIG56239.1 IucA/IucC family siderophore biosynthesis protein [Chitinophaga sp. Cy-1792]